MANRYSVYAGVLAFVLGGCEVIGEQQQTSRSYQAWDYIADGVFTSGIEGPAVGPDGHLYVVNFAREGTIGRVRSSADATGIAELFIKLPAGSTGNGIRFDRQGAMYVADYTGHNILRINPTSREVSVYAHNRDMHQPNDIAITEDGRLYATDPNWADSTGQLWRIERDGSSQVIEAGMGTTNGVAVSPDQQHLYVNESVQRKVWVYDLTDGNISNKRLFIEFFDHGLDGMRCDSQGNLYIARYGAGVVAVVSPTGKLVREIKLKGKRPTNVAFGGDEGKQVYVTVQDRGAIETFLIE